MLQSTDGTFESRTMKTSSSAPPSLSYLEDLSIEEFLSTVEELCAPLLGTDRVRLGEPAIWKLLKLSDRTRTAHYVPDTCGVAIALQLVREARVGIAAQVAKALTAI